MFDKKEKSGLGRVFSMYAVFDVAANEAGPIFIAVNDAVAARQYHGILREVTDPSEYKLYKLGTYDSSDMEVKAYANPVVVFTGKEEDKK